MRLSSNIVLMVDCNSCSGHGQCKTQAFFPDRCKCDSGWTGVDCAVPDPQLYHAPYGSIFSQSIYLNDSRGDAHPLFNLSHMARIYISVDPTGISHHLSIYQYLLDLHMWLGVLVSQI
jgi:hypothetical protein